MNEKIKQLLAQAHLEVDDTKDTNKIAEKFAELIIKECMDVVIKSHNGKINPKFVVEPLIEHFGVE